MTRHLLVSMTISLLLSAYVSTSAGQDEHVPDQLPRSMPSVESVPLIGAPGPRNWRPGIGSGVEFGLRMPRDPVVLGAPIPVEIHIRNGGAEPVDVALLGNGGEESIPPCEFSVRRAAVALMSPGRLAEKATTTQRKLRLQPKEAVMFAVSLDSWVVDGDTSHRGTHAFREPGVYWVECVWEHTGIPPARAAGKLEFIRPGQLPEKTPDPKWLSRSTGVVPGAEWMPDYEVTYEHLAVDLATRLWEREVAFDLRNQEGLEAAVAAGLSDKLNQFYSDLPKKATDHIAMKQPWQT